MTAPSQRRRDPQPNRGWELATAAAGGSLIAVALAALTGLGIASALWGRGWVWPDGTQTVLHGLAGLVHGHPGRGLPPDQLRRVAAPLPVYACVAVAEIVLLTAAALSAVLVARYRRPGDARGGLATRSEAAHALGLRQLRAARALIRPDRYPAGDHAGHLGRLLSTARAAIHSHVHRSVPDTHCQPASSAPSSPTPRPPARTTKELPR